MTDELSSDVFVQHDVQELNRVLCDKLEEKMKGKITANESKLKDRNSNGRPLPIFQEKMNEQS